MTKCKGIDDYEEALKHLLDDHPRVYAAIHAEELLQDLHAATMDGDGVDDYYANDLDDDELFMENEEFKNDGDHDFYSSLHFVDADDDEEEEELEDVDEQRIPIRVHDFQSHPEYEVAFSCESNGQLKLWNIDRRDVRLLRSANMRSDTLQHDHCALCCCVAPLGHYVAFGGEYNDGQSGIVVCYEVESAESLKMMFVVDADTFALDDTVESRDVGLGSVRSVEFDGSGRFLFVGTVGSVWILNVDENGKCIQQIADPQRSTSRLGTVNGLCFHSDYLFVLTSKRCTAYPVHEEEGSNPVDTKSAFTVCSVRKDYAFGPFEYIGVTHLDSDQVMVYVASSRLQWYLLSMDAVDGTLCVTDDVGSGKESVSGWTPTPITSLQIDHKNRVLLVSRKKNIKSYRVGIDEENALRTMDGASPKIAINFGSRKHKQVAVCHENPCSIQLRKYSKR